MMTDDEILAVVQARKEGKRIVCRDHINTMPWTIDYNCSWDFRTYIYRIAPEPSKSCEETMIQRMGNEIVKLKERLEASRLVVGAARCIHLQCHSLEYEFRDLLSDSLAAYDAQMKDDSLGKKLDNTPQL